MLQAPLKFRHLKLTTIEHEWPIEDATAPLVRSSLVLPRCQHAREYAQRLSSTISILISLELTSTTKRIQ